VGKWVKKDEFYMQCGEFTITKPTSPEKYPTPYGLHHRNVIIGHFKTSKEAKEKYEEIK
jgi:hypothetical protein